jgi:hypothetical protein
VGLVIFCLLAVRCTVDTVLILFGSVIISAAGHLRLLLWLRRGGTVPLLQSNAFISRTGTAYK